MSKSLIDRIEMLINEYKVVHEQTLPGGRVAPWPMIEDIPALIHDIRAELNKPSTVLQPWVTDLSFMQQTVLLTAIRGPDNTEKYTPAKMLIRWLRRCTLISAMDKRILTSPCEQGGGSFTGPSFLAVSDAECNEDGVIWEPYMNDIIDQYLRSQDALPGHFIHHLRHATEILGYKHPDLRIRAWWHRLYTMMVKDLHLHPETEAEMDLRLSDNREAWLARNNAATIK